MFPGRRTVAFQSYTVTERHHRKYYTNTRWKVPSTLAISITASSRSRDLTMQSIGASPPLKPNDSQHRREKKAAEKRDPFRLVHPQRNLHAHLQPLWQDLRVLYRGFISHQLAGLHGLRVMIQHFQYIGDMPISCQMTSGLTMLPVSWHAYCSRLQRYCRVHINHISLDVVYALAMQLHILKYKLWT